MNHFTTVEITVEKKAELTEVLEFLKEINDDIFPPLDSRVDLNVYAGKILDFAECLVVKTNDKIQALSAFYCNDFENKVSYLTLIAVGSLLRNQGVATKLLDETIRHAKSKGMKKLVLEVNEQNQPAVKLYQKYGFEIFQTEDNGSVFMQYQIT